MKKVVIKNGLIAGGLASGVMAITMALHNCGADFSGGMIIGYSSMLLAFIFIFVGVKSFRDKQNDGAITFWQGLRIGLLISFIASTMYVITWSIEYHFFLPDFMNQYADAMIKGLKTKHASQATIDAMTAKMAEQKEMYKNPVYFTLFTYAEILPVGILMSLISALIFKKKPEVTVAG
jgi:hypothetical protein